MLCIVSVRSLPAFGGAERHPEIRVATSYGPGTSGETGYYINLSDEEIIAYSDRLPKISPVDVLDKERFAGIRQAAIGDGAQRISTRLPPALYDALVEYTRRERISLNLAMVRAVEQLIAQQPRT